MNKYKLGLWVFHNIHYTVVGLSVKSELQNIVMSCKENVSHYDQQKTRNRNTAIGNHIPVTFVYETTDDVSQFKISHDIT